jgi:hypothetical protein
MKTIVTIQRLELKGKPLTERDRRDFEQDLRKTLEKKKSERVEIKWADR